YKKMEEFAQNSTVPALFVHGDDHKFTIDHPIYYVDKKTGYFGNRPFVTRLQVYGFPNVRAVEVKVEPNSPQPFAFYSLEPIPWQYKK
ncbi:MAG: hypothetical protein KDD40_09180, partial [Bdellovibrionales bacterium]|nr:hypothetical protein [Bdellovibrionales bacterium]